jgi:hypothetical protein
MRTKVEEEGKIQFRQGHVCQTMINGWNFTNLQGKQTEKGIRD